MKIIEIAQAGAVTDAPRLASVLLNVLEFLLRVFGIIAIIGLVISGIIYLTANGNEERINIAKKSFSYSVVGIMVGLGAMIIIKQISSFLG